MRIAVIYQRQLFNHNSTALYDLDDHFMMFYDGDLQSGIALAVREAKSVICFIQG
jgi:hypothetical protein